MGFAGSTADALNLFEKLEEKLVEHNYDLLRAAVELAKVWRTDKALRKLDALLLCVNHENIMLISGAGDVIIPDDGVLAVGSGGNFATAAARALVQHSDLNAEEIVKAAMQITADICIYTNHNITVKTLEK